MDANTQKMIMIALARIYLNGQGDLSDENTANLFKSGVAGLDCEVTWSGCFNKKAVAMWNRTFAKKLKIWCNKDFKHVHWEKDIKPLFTKMRAFMVKHGYESKSRKAA